MKHAIFLAAAFMILTEFPVSARLMETVEQCKARYGEPVAEISASIVGSDEKAHLFNVSTKTGEGKEIRVLIEYKAGVAWFVRYAADSLTKDELTGLRERNKGESLWSEMEEYAGRKFWISKTKDRIATEYMVAQGERRFDFMSKACSEAVAAMTQSQDEAVRAATEWAPPTPANKEDSADKKEDAPEKTPAPSDSKDSLEGL